jgi:glucokinase
MKYYLVFDIGATHLRIAFFKNLKMVDVAETKTINSNKLLNLLVSKTKERLVKYKIKKFEGIAISAPGSLNCEKLELTAPVNLSGVRKLKLSFLKKFCRKLVLENDANCAVLGAFFKEKKPKQVACLTLGTGLGCGLIIQGKLYKGKGAASEFGHTTIDRDGKKCNCNNIGCLENYVSTRGLLNLARSNGLNVDAYQLFESAKKGNKKAIKTYDEFGKYVTIALVNLANTLDPEIIYLTGGLIKAHRFFLKSSISDAKKRFFNKISPKIKFSTENLSLLGGAFLVNNQA